MHFALPCQQCFREGLIADSGKETPYAPTYSLEQFTPIELDRWPFFEWTCPNGHAHRITLSNELYELLFQQAVYCIEDGYYRESIGTFHAALERFMEFATEVLSLKANKDFDFGALWKIIGNQSERQLGAFYITYQLVIGKVPRKLDEDKVRIRNNVIHKGQLVSKSTALEYGQYVFDYIRDASSDIRETLGDDYGIACGFRLLRVSSRDLNKAYETPIKTEVNGEIVYEGVGSTSCPTLITDDTLATIYDCLNRRLGYGLIK